mmetsp:Transcript_34723/g.99983  ORF Transcript_34723/g.99983 Transcript_34723/m.99983 type:complete len:222 (+) Transcript_34723:292-957(+)
MRWLPHSQEVSPRHQWAAQLPLAVGLGRKMQPHQQDHPGHPHPRQRKPVHPPHQPQHYPEHPQSSQLDAVEEQGRPAVVDKRGHQPPALSLPPQAPGLPAPRALLAQSGRRGVGRLRAETPADVRTTSTSHGGVGSPAIVLFLAEIAVAHRLGGDGAAGGCQVGHVGVGRAAAGAAAAGGAGHGGHGGHVHVCVSGGEGVDGGGGQGHGEGQPVGVRRVKG